MADPCGAPLPAKGTPFSGTVQHIIDGDGYCVSDSSDPATWVEVRTADFYAEEATKPGGPEAKAALRRLIFGRRVECVAGHKTYDRTAAVCTLNGTSVGDLMRGAGVVEGGRGK